MLHPRDVTYICSRIEGFTNFLEWGMGGSTLVFSKFVSNYYSIEHNTKWFHKMQEALPNNVKPFLFPADNIPSFGPGNPSLQKDYIEAPKQMGVKFFDGILIDGRCRVECSRIAKDFMNENSVLFIHDFQRTKYHSIRNFLKQVNLINSDGRHLAEFKLFV